MAGAHEWQQDGMAQAWRAWADDGSEQAYVRLVGGEWEAQIHRRPTGPSAPDRDDKQDGPVLFATREEAFAWAEANISP